MCVFFSRLVRLLFIDRQMKSEAIVLASLFPLTFTVILLYLLIYSQLYIQILLVVSNNINVKNVIKFVKQLRITNPSNFRFIFFFVLCFLVINFVKKLHLRTFFLVIIKKRGFNPIQDGKEGQKGPPTSFSPVTSTNVRISP